MSHTLARLRHQLNDPLLIRFGFEMRPSPYAEKVGPEIKRILHSVQSILIGNEDFEPATSSRMFTLSMPDFAAMLIPKLCASIQEEAPECSVHWKSPDSLLEVQSEKVDLLIDRQYDYVPDGVTSEPIIPMRIGVFARRGHPLFNSQSSE